MKFSLQTRRIIGAISRVFSPSYSTCDRCGRPWNVCKEYTVMIDRNRGCFALCTDCYPEATVEERKHYYTNLICSWGVDKDTMRLIDTAIRNIENDAHCV